MDMNENKDLEHSQQEEANERIEKQKENLRVIWFLLKIFLAWECYSYIAAWIFVKTGFVYDVKNGKDVALLLFLLILYIGSR